MWIQIFTVDVLECTINLATTAEPDNPTPKIAWQYVFRAVGNLRIGRYHDSDTPCLGDFSGINVHHLGNGRSRYHLDTGDAEVTFEAATECDVNHLAETPLQKTSWLTIDGDTGSQ